MSKELYISAWEEIYNTLIDAGCAEDIASEVADEKAYDLLKAKLADMIDAERTRRKDEKI